MSKILVDQIRSNSASADAITLDGSGNVTYPANATCSGTATGFGVGMGATETQGYQNLKIYTTANNSTVITCDNVILENSSGALIKVSSVNVTLDATTTGANGLDTGSLATQKPYYVYIINNGSTTASLASLSSTSPTLPSGYTYKARVGAISTTLTNTSLNQGLQVNSNYMLMEQATNSTTTRIKSDSGGYTDVQIGLLSVPATAASWHAAIQTYGATTAGTDHAWKLAGKASGYFQPVYSIYHVTANGIGDLRFRIMDIPILEFSSGVPQTYMSTNSNTGPNYHIHCFGWRY